MSEPEEIATMTGQKIPRKCSIGKCCFRMQLCASFIDFVSHVAYYKTVYNTQTSFRQTISPALGLLIHLLLSILRVGLLFVLAYFKEDFLFSIIFSANTP